MNLSSRGRGGLRRLAGAVTAGEIGRIVVRQPGRALLVLPDQRLQRQVDADGLRLLHQRRAALGVAEDEQISRPQIHADGGSACGVIDMGKHGEALGLHLGLEPLHRVRGSKTALDGDESVRGHGLCLP
jgi:hypothetical protein